MSIKRNLVYNFILSVSQIFLPLLSIPYVSRVLDPAGIGEVSFVDSFTYYFISIAEFGIIVYGIREVARLKDEPAKKDKLVSELVFLHLMSSFVTVILYAIAVYFILNKINDVRILYFSVAYLVVNSFACEWYFIGMERFRYITMRSLISRGLGLIAIFILINEPPDYYIYYAIIASSAILNSVWNNYLLVREVRLNFKSIEWKQHIPRLKITYLISLVYGITLILDNVLLRFVSTASAVGYYAFSVKIVRISTTLISDSLQVFFPRIVAFLKVNDREQLQFIITRNLQLLLLLSIPVSVGIFLLAEPLVIAFLGRQFLPAVDNLRILAIFPILKAYNHFLSRQVLISHNRERFYLSGLFIAGFSFIALMLFLSTLFADTGASYAVVLAEIVLLLANLHYVRKTTTQLKIFDLRTCVQALLGAVIFVPVVYFLKQSAWSYLGILISSIIVCVIAYVMIQIFVIRNDFMLILKNIFLNRGRSFLSFIQKSK